MSDEITLDYHKEYSYNCLNDVQFELLQKQYKVGEHFMCWDCNVCESFFIGGPLDHRCDCGNRRCYFVYNECIDPIENYFSIEVDQSRQ